MTDDRDLMLRRLLADAVPFCRRLAGTDLAGVPIEVRLMSELHGEDVCWNARCGGYCDGALVVINDHDELMALSPRYLLFQWHRVLIHELAHVVVNAVVGRAAPPPRPAAAVEQMRVWLTDPATDFKPCGNVAHGRAFQRVLYHLHHRARWAGLDLLDLADHLNCDSLDDPAAVRGYWRQLGDEPARCRFRSFRDTLLGEPIVSDIFTALHQTEADRLREHAAAWADLVRLTADGHADDAEAVGRELVRLGRTASDLRSAAALQLKRRDVRAAVAEMPARRDRVAEIDNLVSQADVELREAQARHRQTVVPLAAERAQLTQELLRENELRRELITSCADDDLVGQYQRVQAAVQHEYAKYRAAVQQLNRLRGQRESAASTAAVNASPAVRGAWQANAGRVGRLIDEQQQRVGAIAGEVAGLERRQRELEEAMVRS